MTDYTTPPLPYTFIQWKGTNVCLDFHCRCGAYCHFDGDFAYGLRCPHCETVWEMPIYLTPVKGTPDSGIVQDMDPEPGRPVVYDDTITPDEFRDPGSET